MTIAPSTSNVRLTNFAARTYICSMDVETGGRACGCASFTCLSTSRHSLVNCSIYADDVDDTQNICTRSHSRSSGCGLVYGVVSAQYKYRACKANKSTVPCLSTTPALASQFAAESQYYRITVTKQLHTANSFSVCLWRGLNSRRGVSSMIARLQKTINQDETRQGNADALTFRY